jgi:hypothetical protein
MEEVYLYIVGITFLFASIELSKLHGIYGRMVLA